MASLPKKPDGFFDIVGHAMADMHHDHRSADSDHPSTPPLAKPPVENYQYFSHSHNQEHNDEANGHWREQGQDGVLDGSTGLKKRPPIGRRDASPPSPNSRISFPSNVERRPPRRNLSASTYRSPIPGTPQQRTGPPRSISYSYSFSSAHGHSFSPAPGQSNSSAPSRQTSESHVDEDPDRAFDFPPVTSPFRGALEYQDPEQRERERSMAERKHKRRDSYFHDAPWNPMKWISESPRGSQDDLHSAHPTPRTDSGHPEPEDEDPPPSVTRHSAGPSRLRRGQSLPHMGPGSTAGSPSTPTLKWGRLKSLLPHITGQSKAQPPHSVVTSHNVNITDELITGGLATLMLRLWVERDEKGHRRVPGLFHRLRIRVSDSLHPMQGKKAVFRIECEYANGAVRWVVYRQLREFISLHGHYTIANAYNRSIETFPDFPMHTLPYFKWLKERHGELGRADFARIQRETIENYLISVIRAVMFHPSVNRLAGFLEFGALTVALAQSGGAQYKAGFLYLDGVAPKPSFGRRSAGWREKKKQRWCAVRESYLVAMEEMGELTVWDVFLLDQDFQIERPTRYYRQGLNLIHGPEASSDSEGEGEHEQRQQPHIAVNGHDVTGEPVAVPPRKRLASTVGSIKSSISRALSPKKSLHSRNNTSANNLSAPRRSNDTGGASVDSASSISGPPTRAATPMLDPSTHTNPLALHSDHEPEHDEHDEHPQSHHRKRNSKDVSKHVFYVVNSQTRLKLYAKNERQMLQWIAALERVARESHYTGKNRFDSFAPIRLNVAAQWLVDGRDYFWNLSRAILLARESIQIHDWWLSPELLMRRPGKDRYRLDRLLEKKAKEGVKIYVILYQEVSSRTTPTDSNYAKQRLASLHPNIMVQRSPSHFQTGTFYWAHHEKLCVIDQAIAFMGGLDHCFGRWDTPQHVLIDDPDDESEQIWPGKDYSNPRISDFHTLNKPFEDMYERAKVPRMPWHDVSMQIVGQPARDLARHFVQRWNHLLRIKNHSRTMPFLLPPPEFKPGELADMGLTGTCELQICRSAGPWSLGTPDRVEHSIQNAYLKAIQLSEHFVYIENQFFITSTVVNEVKIENRIGDAIVQRAIRAHREGIPWKCCIVIPLLPGFSFPVDHSDASAIRIIIECQNRTICRGPNSIFARLRKEGIDPDDHVTVFSLRSWGKLRDNVLTTEQVYIHGKVCIVDDRLAIIGSANINERSQRGDRDSEIAAVIRDTDMIDCNMAGKPFKVGRFAHTLRVRLMREHLGVDVDALYEEDLMASSPTKEPHEQEPWDPEHEQEYGRPGVTRIKHHQQGPMNNMMHDASEGVKQVMHAAEEIGSTKVTRGLRSVGIKSHGLDASAGDTYLDEERKMYERDGEKVPGFASSVVPTLEEKTIHERRPKQRVSGTPIEEALDEEDHTDSPEKIDGDVTPRPPTSQLEGSNGVADPGVKSKDFLPSNGANGHVEQNGSAKRYEPHQARLETGELYGAPADASVDPQHDDQPPHARSGKVDADEGEERAPGTRSTLRKHLTAKLGNKQWQLPTPTPVVDPNGFEDPVCDAFWKDVWVACAVHNTEIYRKVFHAIPDDIVTTWKQYKEFIVHHERLNKPLKDSDPSGPPLARVPSEAADHDAPGQQKVSEHAASASQDALAREKEHADDEDARDAHTPLPDSSTPVPGQREREKEKRAPVRGPQPFDRAEREEMENLLNELRGHLVVYPTRFLEGEDVTNNFLFPSDRLLPLPIYD
ncbi:phospholipase D [Epithele typhae]|uniref:phospholipase D n=1 Tax=Epithele typhae TaxID=378194 RepID=UPI002007B90A|nr:phospholipase D [Epithele typhae]KAH9925437.1 phospholipase D [Epithele typhae]